MINKQKGIIVGKSSFIGSNISNFLKNKKVSIKLISFGEFVKVKSFKNYSFIINCAITKEYIKDKYKVKNDISYQIAKIIQKENLTFFNLSTRKVYKNNTNLKENSFLEPKDFYSKNNIITEKKITKLLKNKCVILRLSNIIGLPNKKKNLFKTYSYLFFKKIKNNYFYINRKNDFKDFLSIKMLCKIFYKLIAINKLSGVYNVSLGQKVYLNQINTWLNYYNPKKKNKYIFMHNKDNFYLNNTKLIKKIKLKPSLNNLKLDCYNFSYNFFKNSR